MTRTKGVEPPFDSDDLDVEWGGTSPLVFPDHKYSIPYLETSVRATNLFSDQLTQCLPIWSISVLKPLYACAVGGGRWGGVGGVLVLGGALGLCGCMIVLAVVLCMFVR